MLQIPGLLVGKFRSDRTVRLPLLLVSALALSLGACDPSRSLDANQPVLEEAVSYELVPGPRLSAAERDSISGCAGTIWEPEAAEYVPINLKIHLPQKLVDTAGGATYEPYFKLHDEEDPSDRLLMELVCTLPDVDDPELGKTHAYVAMVLANDVKKLQREIATAAQPTR